MIYLILSTLAILQGIFGLLDGIRSARHIRRYRPISNWRPRVLVICPCKGIDSEFRANAASILNQDYPNLRVVFVVESEDDPANKQLRELNAIPLVAGIATLRGQKAPPQKQRPGHPWVGQVVAVRRSSGALDREWEIVDVMHDEQVVVQRKQTEERKLLKRSQILDENPKLAAKK